MSLIIKFVNFISCVDTKNQSWNLLSIFANYSFIKPV
jgi:hypothetical protein